MRRILGFFVGLLMWALLPGSAAAILITTANAPVGFSIVRDVGGGLVLSATGSVTVTGGFNSSSIVLHVVLNNASTLNGVPLTPAANVQLSGWGFGVDPNATGVTFSGPFAAGLIDASLDNLPSVAAIEVCANGGNGCSGAANGGIQAGNSDVFDLILAGHWGNAITFDPLGARFEASGTSYDFACPPYCGSVGGDISVPEPQTLALVGLGLLALGAFAARRRTQRH
ncbi:MAG: PEP-CTERM sorting domain-containing protein [Betaproteobacteria bacterium]|nr:MAG: PEP-CTERM sorting domain-containing protein [Betaproteobacteria bacterium]TMH68640.1 MAG: PEP-CTERM sorting domain-containing protein [Betaproteobacteria bacterium]